MIGKFATTSKFRPARLSVVTVASFVVVVLMTSLPLRADVYWSTSAGDWSVPSNWGGSLVPTGNDTAYIVNGGTANITTSGDVCNVLSLTGTVLLAGGGLLSASSEYLGYFGAGTFTQSGGTNNPGGLYLGYNPASSGNYHLSGPGLLSAFDEFVGYNGTGAFTQSGGTNNSIAGLYLGYYAGSSGSCNLISGLLSTSSSFSSNEYVGCSGSGAFAQTGGTNNLGSGYLYIGGYSSGSSGSYNLSGTGLLSAGGVFVGSSGTGTFTQTGGSNSVGLLNIGNLGRYQFSGGTLQVTGPALVNQGSFDATQSTGLLAVTGSAMIDLSQATLVNTNSMSVSIGPNSLLLLPAGFNPVTAFGSYMNAGLTHSVGAPLTILPGQGFSGIGTLTDHVSCQGTISATTYGSINLNGGVTISGTGNVSLGSGTLGVDDALSGITAGSLSAYTELVGNVGSGAFTQSGGTNSLGSSSGGLYLGNNAGSSGVYYLSGPGVLSVSGTECVACSGTGTIHQEGGSNSVSLLSIGNLGRYQFGGGTLQVGSGLANQGVFDATGSAGLLTATGSAIIDFSTGTLQNTASMSLNIGPDSLLLVPAGFNPATALGSYSNLGLTHNVGTPLTILPGQGFAGAGAIADLVNCQGTISATIGPINLNGGVAISGTGSVSLGSGTLSVDGASSSITGGSLSAGYACVGYSGTGAFTQSGGTNNIGTFENGGGLYLGYGASSSGSYNLSGAGVLAAPAEYVGCSGSGTFTQSGGTNGVGGGMVALYLGYNAGSSGSYNLSGSGVISAPNDTYEYVGYSGAGSFTQSGGTNNIIGSGGLYLGYNAGSSGSYNLSGAGVLNSGEGESVSNGEGEYVGYSGTGTFTQSGGTNNIGRTDGASLYVGYGANSSGSYNLSGSGVLAASFAYVGYSGSGTFTQSGGTNSSGLYLGYGDSSSGSYNLSGSGVLTASAEVVGNFGTGTFTQSGGTNNSTGSVLVGGLYLGYKSGSSGSYNLSGTGMLSAPSAAEYVGYNGTGAFTQSGGTNSLGMSYGGLSLGYGASSSGVYNLSGSGVLAAYSEYVGYSSTGTFTQSGGTNSFTQWFYLGYASGSSGSYNLSGAGVLSGTSEYVGVANNGTGAFTQSGGTNSFSGGLYLGDNPGSSGSYNLSGAGVLSGSSEYVGFNGKGAFTQSGGTNNLGSGSLILGNSAGSSGSYNLNGSGVISAGIESVGSSGTGTFNQSGGTNIVTSMLSLGASGTYNLTGGILLVSDIQGDGAGTVDMGGGTLKAIAGFSTSEPMTLTGGGATFDTAGYAVTLFGSLSGPGSLTKVDSGTLILASPNTFVGGTTIVGGTLQLGDGVARYGSVQGNVADSGVLAFAITNPLNQYYAGQISGSGGVTKTGRGTLVLSGSNSYSGPTLINAGVLQIGTGGSGASIGGTSGVTDNANLIFANGDAVTFNAPVTGNGSLTQTGSGIVTLTNVNAYSGTTTINGGTLQLANGGSLSKTSSESVGYNGTGALVQSGGTNGAPGTTVVYLGYNAGDSGTYFLSGGVSRAATEYVGGSGTGTFTQSGGSNQIPSLYLGGNVGSSGNYNLGGGLAQTSYEYVGYKGAGIFTQSGGTNNVSRSLILGNSGGSSGSYNLSGSGVISAYTESIGSSGTGMFNQSGGTNIVTSMLSLGASGTYNLTGGILLASGIQGAGTFDVGGGAITAGAGFSTSQPMTLTGSGGATFGTAGYAVTLSGSLSGPGSLTKLDSGTLTLAATNTYSGNTLIGGGVLALASPPALQNSTLDTSGSGVLNFGSLTAATLGGLTGPGTLSLSNSASSAVALSVGNNNADTTFSGMLTGPGSLNKFGSGSLVLLGTDSYTGGTTVTAGTLILANNQALPDGTNLTVSAGGTFIFDPSVAAAPAAGAVAVAVPEPSTLALLTVGTLGLLGCAWRRRRSWRPAGTDGFRQPETRV